MGLHMLAELVVVAVAVAAGTITTAP